MLAALALPLLAAASAHAGTYSLAENNVGSDFLNNFQHEAISDPTHGRVNYVDQATALAQNLTFASANSFVMRADHTTVLSATGPGRNSVRIRSNAAWTTHVVVMDIRHMPQGCGTWPAAWETLESDWPESGEVDIVEGVNDVVPNQSTLHTSAGCNMPASNSAMTGTVASTDCSTADDGNAGCGIKSTTAASYGPPFNAAGGGFYAMERTASTISVWFWQRGSAVPSDVVANTGSVNTAGWGKPYALFPSTSCNLGSKFGENNIIINLTLCGDWAGAVFTSDGCGSDCTSFVNANPASFVNAYWDFARLSVYT